MHANVCNCTPCAGTRCAKLLQLSFRLLPSARTRKLMSNASLGLIHNMKNSSMYNTMITGLYCNLTKWHRTTKCFSTVGKEKFIESSLSSSCILSEVFNDNNVSILSISTTAVCEELGGKIVTSSGYHLQGHEASQRFYCTVVLSFSNYFSD